MQGHIVRYIDSRGFGFIRGADAIERFFHINDFVGGQPAMGVSVEFDIAPATGGRSKGAAVHVRPLSR